MQLQKNIKHQIKNYLIVDMAIIFMQNREIGCYKMLTWLVQANPKKWLVKVSINDYIS